MAFILYLTVVRNTFCIATQSSHTETETMLTLIMCHALLFSIYFLINASHNPLNWFHNPWMGLLFLETLGSVGRQFSVLRERGGDGEELWLLLVSLAVSSLALHSHPGPSTSMLESLLSLVPGHWRAHFYPHQPFQPSSQFPQFPPIPFSSKDHPEFQPDLWISWPSWPLQTSSGSPLNSRDPPQLNDSHLWFLAPFPTNSPLVSGLSLVFGSPKFLSNCSPLRTWITLLSSQ